MNKTNLIPKEDIAKMYHCECSEVNCLHCRFSNFETVNLDTSMINCWLWKTSTSTRAFCTHWQPEIRGGWHLPTKYDLSNIAVDDNKGVNDHDRH